MDIWKAFWHFWLVSAIVVSACSALIVIVGGMLDMVGFIRDLREEYHRLKGRV